MPADIRIPSPINQPTKLTFGALHPGTRLAPDPVRCQALGTEADILRAAKEIADAVKAQLVPGLAAAVQAPAIVRSGPSGTPAAPPKLAAKGPMSPRQGYQLGDILTAIDEGNDETLGTIREKNFHLFLSGSGVLNPLRYAMNTRNEPMVIVVLGILSSWVNHLDAKTLATHEGRETLNHVRCNLHFAIRFALEQNVPSSALASYVQTLVMSQGDDWLRNAVHTLGSDVAKGNFGKAHAYAEQAMHKFIGDALKAAHATEVEDYRLNATTDLIMMGCAEAMGAPIGMHCFARDRRVLDELRERIRTAKRADLSPSQAKVLRRCDLVADIMSAGNLSYDGKVELLLSHAK